MKKTISVTINGEEITMYYGATLRNALLKVDEKLYDQVMNREAEIRDQFGNHVEIGGAIDNGFSYTVVSN